MGGGKCTCAALGPEVAVTARINRLKMGGGRVCWRVIRVARGLPENFTKFMRCPMASSIFPAHMTVVVGRSGYLEDFISTL